MLRGINSAASGMFSLERKQETLADNLANAQTPGFKKDDTTLRAFPKMLLQRIQDFQGTAGGINIPSQPVPIGELVNGVYAQERVPRFTQGTLVQTDHALDVAISDQSIPAQTINGRQVKPAAFFAVQFPDGSIGYTRNGKWDLDANGNLVTSEGYRVLGANHQPLQLNTSVSKEDLQIDSNGKIRAYPSDPARTQVVGEIGMAIANNPNDLSRAGSNVYTTDNSLPFIQDQGVNPGVSLKQGFIEQSNVDPGQTMTDMMMTIRGYEANQKVLGAYDQSLQQLYSVGKING